MALMCGGGGGEPVDPELAAINEQAKNLIASTERAQQKITKMLLLGAGESGKSTIFKQMKIINKDGYSEEERKGFIAVVHSNTVQSMQALMGGFAKCNVPMPDDLAALNAKFDGLKGAEKLGPEITPLIGEMWAHAAAKGVFERRSEFQLNDSAEYYFNELERISAAGYIPSEQDVLRSRVRTTGIVQSDFKIKSMDFAMFDVGGQRNERRKWIHAFDNVDAVVFVAALSEYDQVLFEDETMNRMDEALTLFDQIANSKWFKQTAMILFLNKKDLFEEKLKKKPLKQYYAPAQAAEDIKDDTDMEQCANYFKKAFVKKSKTDKSIYTHITTAIDTSNVKFVFNAVLAMLLEQNLKGSGLM